MTHSVRKSGKYPHDGSLDSLYELLHCDLATVAHCGEFDLFVDDEGLFKADQKFFMVDGFPQPLAGYALVVAVDENCDTIAPDLLLEELEARVLFIEAIEWEGGRMKNLDHMDAMSMLEWAVALLGEMLETIDNAMEGDHPARAEIVAFLDAVSDSTGDLVSDKTAHED